MRVTLSALPNVRFLDELPAASDAPSTGRIHAPLADLTDLNGDRVVDSVAK
jgi:hypothetical protein